MFIGAFADEPVKAQAPREAHGATREGARGPRGGKQKAWRLGEVGIVGMKLVWEGDV